jgi:caffeoyl-CoA O-methyltransferase
MIVDSMLEDYAAEHSSPQRELFTRLDAETREKTTAPQMMVGPLEGGFLAELVRLSGARRILELGTFTGYSSISMALALPPEGRIVSCDVNEETTAIAKRYAEEAGVLDRIDYRLGPAERALETLDGPFDLIFIDADKINYATYYEAALPKLAPDGLMIADNVLWSGRVIDGAVDDEDTQAIRAFNDRIASDERVDAVMLTVRDGMTLIRHRSRP